MPLRPVASPRVLLAALLLLATLPAAGGEPGRVEVEVRVRDAGGRPVPGAEVQLESGRIVLRCEAQGDAAPALLRSVAPGAWQLRVTAAGRGSGPWPLQLRVDEHVVAEVRLEPEGTEAPASLSVSRHRVTVGTPMGPDRLRDLPRGPNIWSLLETFEPVAIVDRQDSGGLFAGEPGRVTAHGSSWTQTSFRAGGLDVTDPARVGTPLLVPLLDAYQSLDFTSALLPVETGGPGGLLTLVPRSPGREWGGTLRAGGLGAGMQQSNARPGVPSIARFDSFLDAGLVAGGPLSSRVGLLVAGGWTRSRRFERDRPGVLEGETGGGIAHLVFSPSPTEELGLIVGHERSAYPYPGRARYAGDPVQGESFSHLAATWERRPDRGLRWSLSVGWLRGRLQPRLTGAEPVAVDRLFDGPVPELARSGDATHHRLGVEMRLRPDLAGFQGGRHHVRIGVSLSRNGADIAPPGDMLPLPELVDGTAARVWEYGWTGPESRWRSTELAAWAADRLTVGTRLEVEAGARFDLATGSAAGAERGIHWVTVSPRLGFRHDLIGRGRVALFGGLARYRHRLPLDLLGFGDPAGLAGSVYRWNDADGDGVFDAGERGTLVALAGPGGSGVGTIDPHLKRPHTDELVLGLEGRIARDFSIRFTAIARRERDLVESVNVGVGRDDYSVILVDDPSGDFDDPADDQRLPLYDRDPLSFGRDRFLLTNPGADHSARYEGVELVLERQWGDAAWLLLAGTAHRSEGTAANIGFRAIENDQGVVGELFDQPNAFTFARGRLFSDRAYTINLAGGARLPGDFRLGAIARYQDGQDFARLVVANGLSQGSELVRATPNGRHRFTFALTVDVRVEKGFRLGRGRLAAVAEAFNVLNTANDVEEDPVARPQFRNPTAVQPPAALRLGLRLDF